MFIRPNTNSLKTMFFNHLFQSEQMTSCVKGPTVHTKHLAMFLGKNSIIHKDGTEWKTHRKNMTKTFNSDTIDNIDGPVRKETSKFVEALLEEVDSTKDGEYRMNGEVLSAALVSNIVGKVFFGLKLQGSVLERDELSSVYDSLLGEFDRHLPLTQLRASMVFLPKQISSTRKTTVVPVRCSLTPSRSTTSAILLPRRGREGVTSSWPFSTL